MSPPRIVSIAVSICSLDASQLLLDAAVSKIPRHTAVCTCERLHLPMSFSNNLSFACNNGSCSVPVPELFALQTFILPQGTTVGTSDTFPSTPGLDSYLEIGF